MARAEAMRLLAEGFTLSSIAAELDVDRCTVREWRDSPAGRAELAAARKAREASFADAVADAHRIVRENLPRALLVLVDVMKELPATLVLRPFNTDTLAVMAYQLARDERLGEAALPSLALVLVGLLPVILLSRTLRRS